MVKLIHKRLNGSILEPMIALMIILFALTASFTIVFQANQYNNVPVSVRAQQLSQRILYETLKESKFVDEDYVMDGLKAWKKISYFDREHNLLLIEIDVSDNKDKLLSSRKRIIISDAEE